jgi:hypothetical protein
VEEAHTNKRIGVIMSGAQRLCAKTSWFDKICKVLRTASMSVLSNCGFVSIYMVGQLHIDDKGEGEISTKYLGIAFSIITGITSG